MKHTPSGRRKPAVGGVHDSCAGSQSSHKRLTYGSQGHYRRTDVKGDVVNALLAQPQHARRMGVVCSAEESVA